LKWIIFQLSIVTTSLAFSSIERSPASSSEKMSLLNDLMGNSLVYSAQEIIRSDLQKGQWSKNYEDFINIILNEVGSEQLDRLSFSSSQIKRSKNISYLHGKNELRKNKFKSAAKSIKRSLKSSEPFYVNQLLFLGSAQMLSGEKGLANNSFMECEAVLKNNIPKDEGLFGNEKRIILDSCILNQARLDFEQGNFLLANQQYDKIQKSSLVWPEILFEQAWSSFYLGNYNRTLGKLVTYKSPFFDFIFNPEVEVLEALSYMEICYYQNTQDVVNKFYKKYSHDAKYLKSFMKRYGSREEKVGSLLINVKNREAIKNPLLKRIVISISKDLVFKRLIRNYYGIKDELKLVKNYPQRKYISYLAKKLKAAEKRQRALIGSYGLRILNRADRLLDKSFRGMSYIKLEILKKEKEKFFGKQYNVGKVGDLKNVTYDSTSYLWDFNGEFWADELGDYVFSLKSECRI